MAGRLTKRPCNANAAHQEQTASCAAGICTLNSNRCCADTMKGPPRQPDTWLEPPPYCWPLTRLPASISRGWQSPSKPTSWTASCSLPPLPTPASQVTILQQDPVHRAEGGNEGPDMPECSMLQMGVADTSHLPRNKAAANRYTRAGGELAIGAAMALVPTAPLVQEDPLALPPVRPFNSLLAFLLATSEQLCWNAAAMENHAVRCNVHILCCTEPSQISNWRSYWQPLEWHNQQCDNRAVSRGHCIPANLNSRHRSMRTWH